MRKFTVLAAVPGSTTFREIVEHFCRRCKRSGGDGVITAFADAALPMCERFADEDVAEVLSFGEVVRRYLVLCGEEAWPLAQAGHVEAAIARACRELPEETPFAKTANFAGVHKAIATALKELHEWEIDRSEMRRLVSVAAPRLGQKLASLAEIDEYVENVLASLRAQTHRAQIRGCLDATPEMDGAFPRLLVHVGAEDSPLKLRWVRWAAEHGTSVTVVLERHAAESPIFAGATRAAEALAVVPDLQGEGNRLTRNLFAHENTGGPPIEAAIVSTADPLAEAEWALRSCLKELKPGKSDAEQSGIYARNLELYAPLLEAAGKRLGVPVQIARRAPLLTNSFARLTLTAIDFCASNDVRTLRPILQSSYLGLSGVEQERVRSVLRDAYRGRASQWDGLRVWVDAHAEEVPWLRELLDWRARALENLTLREWKNLLAELIRPTEKFPWSLRVMDDPTMSTRDRYARNQLERLLANHITVEDLFDKRSYSLSEVAALCRRLWQDADVSIPSAEHGIVVADDPYRLPDVPELRVMGMLEGVFPRRRSEDPILTDSERDEISTLRPAQTRLPTSHDRAAAERDAFYRVCSVAQRRIVFSYPLADDSRDNIPAFYLTEVERAMGAVPRTDHPRTDFAPLREICVADRDLALREALTAPREYPPAVGVSSEIVKAMLRPAETHRFTPRELRTILQCPFQYTVRHRIKLRVRRPSERWQSLAKLPQVATLLTKTDPSAAETALMAALDAELDQLYSEVPDWEMQLLRSGGRRLIQDWLRREFRSRDIWPKDMIRVNEEFGSDWLNGTMPGGVRLGGTLPAISRHKGYSIAHLYESGLRDPKNISDVERLYFGLHFLALHESGREGAIEIESMRGKRELMVLTRSGGEVSGQVQDALFVVDLSTADDPVQSKREFYTRVRELLKIAVDRANQGRIDALKGDHCDFCDYGELCRSSRTFGEDASPFGDDIEP